MDHEEKVRRLREHLMAAGEPVSMAMPPAYRLAWRLGFRWTPPLFARFWVNVLQLGVLWSLLVLCVTWVMSWWHPPARGLAPNIAVLVITGFGFGLAMAAMFRATSRKLGLSSWEDYRGISSSRGHEHGYR